MGVLSSDIEEAAGPVLMAFNVTESEATALLVCKGPLFGGKSSVRAINQLHGLVKSAVGCMAAPDDQAKSASVAT